MAEILQEIHQAKDLWVLELPAVLPLVGRPSQKVQLGFASPPLGCPDIPARVSRQQFFNVIVYTYIHIYIYITYAYAYIYTYMVSY